VAGVGPRERVGADNKIRLRWKSQKEESVTRGSRQSGRTHDRTTSKLLGDGAEELPDGGGTLIEGNCMTGEESGGVVVARY